MLINSSSRSLSSPLICLVNESLYPAMFSCFDDSRNTIHYSTNTLSYLVFLLPLSFLVLWMGFKQYKSSTTGQTSPTDAFTYCMAVLELVNIMGMFSFLCAIYSCVPTVMVLGYFCASTGSPAQTIFHCLTCVERYIAVIHPIFYMRLKQSNRVRIRNIIVVCALLLSFINLGTVAGTFPIFPVTLYFSIFAFIVLAVCYCSLAVFYFLIHSGMRSDQTKWRAFHTILAITGALLLRFCGQVLAMATVNIKMRTKLDECTMFIFGSWMCLPSSLVLPLLFLNKNRKLTCLKSPSSSSTPYP